MRIRKISDNKPRIVIFQGSSRDVDTCPGMESKTAKIVEYVIDKWSPFIDFDLVDLSVNQEKRSIIQPCKGCISTSSYHCHWKCTCYFPDDESKPDLLHDESVYDRLEKSDGFLVFSPIYWHAPSTQIKSLFDRLVCANMTLTKEDVIKIMGKDNIKNPKVTGEFSLKADFDSYLKNHLEGKVAGFYIHGDMGANDYTTSKLPSSFSKKEELSWFGDAKGTIMPIVLQCKYSGIDVPDNLIEAFYTNKGVAYYDANLQFSENSEFFERADKLIENLLNYFD